MRAIKLVGEILIYFTDSWRGIFMLLATVLWALAEVSLFWSVIFAFCISIVVKEVVEGRPQRTPK